MVLVLKNNLMSCFCYVRTASILSFLLLVLAAIILIPTQYCDGSPQTDDSAAKVKALIRDLRDPKFAVREAATQRLIEIGSPARDALRLASESDSLEVRVRAQTILASILQDRDSSFGSSEQATIKQFKDAESASRVAILRAQTTTGNGALLLHLLDIVIAEEANSTNEDQDESPIQTLLDADSITQMVSNSLRSRNWSNIQKILTHPGILKYSPMLRVTEAHQAGRLDAYTEDLFQKFSQAHATQKTTPKRELISLVGLLRVKRDFERAETVIGWLNDVDLQRKLRDAVVFQQGDWQEILRRTKLDPDAPDFISVNLLQEALLHHLIGDKAAVEEVKQKLRKQLQAAIESAAQEKGPEEEEAEQEDA